MPYIYDTERNRYINADNNRPISWARIERESERFETAQKVTVRQLSEQLANNQLTLEQWHNEMRAVVKRNYIAQYLLGRGGRDAMTQSDWGRVGGLLSNQFRYLSNFAREISLGLLSEEQIGARAELYIDSASQSFERAKGAARGLELPAWPGDGTSECMANCKCHWALVELDDLWECTWTINAVVENCETCATRSTIWAPLIIYK